MFVLVVKELLLENYNARTWCLGIQVGSMLIREYGSRFYQRSTIAGCKCFPSTRQSVNCMTIKLIIFWSKSVRIPCRYCSAKMCHIDINNLQLERAKPERAGYDSTSHPNALIVSETVCVLCACCRFYFFVEHHRRQKFILFFHVSYPTSPTSNTFHFNVAPIYTNKNLEFLNVNFCMQKRTKCSKVRLEKKTTTKRIQYKSKINFKSAYLEKFCYVICRSFCVLCFKIIVFVNICEANNARTLEASFEVQCLCKVNNFIFLTDCQSIDMNCLKCCNILSVLT